MLTFDWADRLPRAAQDSSAQTQWLQLQELRARRASDQDFLTSTPASTDSPTMQLAGNRLQGSPARPGRQCRLHGVRVTAIATQGQQQQRPKSPTGNWQRNIPLIGQSPGNGVCEVLLSH